MRSYPRAWEDPGKCPVDDTPGHLCVSADYNRTTGRSVVVRPMSPATSVTILASTGEEVRTDPVKATPAKVPATEPPVTFTTATYKRAVHGPEALAKRRPRR